MCSAVYAFPYLAQEPQEKNKHQAGENQRPLEVTGGGGGGGGVLCCGNQSSCLVSGVQGLRPEMPLLWGQGDFLSDGTGGSCQVFQQERKRG